MEEKNQSDQFLDRLEAAQRQQKRHSDLSVEWKTQPGIIAALPRCEEQGLKILELRRCYGPAMKRAAALAGKFGDSALNNLINQFQQCVDIARQIADARQWYDSLRESDFERLAESFPRKGDLFHHFDLEFSGRFYKGDVVGHMERVHAETMDRLKRLDHVEGRRAPESAILPSDSDEVRVIINQPENE